MIIEYFPPLKKPKNYEQKNQILSGYGNDGGAISD